MQIYRCDSAYKQSVGNMIILRDAESALDETQCLCKIKTAARKRRNLHGHKPEANLMLNVQAFLNDQNEK